MSHPEWQKENSLTSPEDRDLTNKWRPDTKAPPLTAEQADAAIQELNDEAFVSKFPRVDRVYADPPIPMQYIGLISFVPAKGATPNENGVFGFAKLRGNYSTDIDANERAETLIRNHDSHHKIYHTYVGRPFPITASSKYSAETSEVDIRSEMSKAISTDLKEKKQDDMKKAKEIKDRQQQLLDESKQESVDPYDEYITLKVKKAQLSWTYLEHYKKIEEVRVIINNTRKDLDRLDAEHPDFKHNYFTKYKTAREEAGLKDTGEELKNSFMRYLVEDVELPDIDYTYEPGNLRLATVAVEKSPAPEGGLETVVEDGAEESKE